jgi:G3E family GTPase
MPDHQPIPVTLLTGFLGAGKTTLLNRILKSDYNATLAVIVNDFGAINIDARLVEHSSTHLIRLQNGCICCSIQGDFIDALHDLVATRPQPDYIVIEASGVSDPRQILLAMNRRGIRNHVQIDSIITMVDAEQFDDLGDKQRRLAEDQLKMAGVVILNKMDLVERLKMSLLHREIERLAPQAHILKATEADVPLDNILHIGTYNPQTAFDTSGHGVHIHKVTEEDLHDHSDHSLVFSTWTWSSDAPLALETITNILRSLSLRIFRVKGILYVQEYPDTPLILQMVGKRITLQRGTAWHTPAHTDITMIGEKGCFDTTLLEAAFESALSPATNTDDHQDNSQFTDGAIRWLRIPD